MPSSLKGVNCLENSSEEKIIVLVADDDADDCLLIRDAVFDSGMDWETQFVGDGIELMEYLENCIIQEEHGACCFPKLILLDLNMPRKGGREALKEISVDSRLNKIPIIILTTSDEPQDIALCSSLGAKLFITKPNMYTDWLERVRTLKEFV